MSSNYRSILNAQGSSFASTNSFTFDGNTDFVQSASTYSQLDGQSKATYSMWLKPTSSSALIRSVFQIGNGASGGNGVCQLYIYQGNRIDFSISSSSTYGRADISSLNYGSWNHLLIAVDLDSTDEFRCYLNGSDVTTSDSLGGRTAFLTATEPLYIGEFTTGSYSPFLGNIDEFAIWSGTALTLSDAVSIYNSGAPNNLNDSDVVATAPTTWYRMGEDATYAGGAWTLVDQGSGSNNGSSTTLPPEALSTDVPT